jgi:hypothetical protein
MKHGAEMNRISASQSEQNLVAVYWRENEVEVMKASGIAHAGGE